MERGDIWLKWWDVSENNRYCRYGCSVVVCRLYEIKTTEQGCLNFKEKNRK